MLDADASRSIVAAPSRARPVWLVTRPTRRPASDLKPSARATSTPARTGCAGAAVTGAVCDSNACRLQMDSRAACVTPVVSDDCTIVATRARSAATSPLPSGWRRLDRNTMYTCVAGSIQIDVPVKPVCPNDPSGMSSPRFTEKLESMSHPKPRTFASPAGVAGDVMRATASGDSTRAPPGTAPPPSSMRQKRARSSAVLKSPAWPATPPIRRAVGSCTTPRSIVIFSPSHGQPNGVQDCVGAMRGTSAAGGLNIVSFMPSGRKIRERAKVSNGWPLTRATTSASRK